MHDPHTHGTDWQQHNYFKRSISKLCRRCDAGSVPVHRHALNAAVH